MISKDQFHGLHKELMAEPGVEGGFTIHAQTGERPTEGHMVSYQGTERLTSPAEATRPRDLANYVRTQREALGRPDVYFGGWKPESGEFTTLDRSQVIKPDPKTAAQHGAMVADADARTSALDLAIARDQFATFDLKRGRSDRSGVTRE